MGSYFLLLLVCFSAIFLGFHDDNRVHRIAALTVGLITFVWGFVMAPLPMQISISFILIVGSRKMMISK